MKALTTKWPTLAELGVLNISTPKQFPQQLQGLVAVDADSGCWNWIGTRQKEAKGKLPYGTIQSDGKRWKAHRFLWVLTRGDVPAGLVVCHRCDNPPCVNPEHLFLGTHSENTLDSIAKGRRERQPKAFIEYREKYQPVTHCGRGHEYSGENLAVKNGKRWCRTCMKERRELRPMTGGEYHALRAVRRYACVAENAMRNALEYDHLGRHNTAALCRDDAANHSRQAFAAIAANRSTR